MLLDGVAEALASPFGIDLGDTTMPHPGFNPEIQEQPGVEVCVAQVAILAEPFESRAHWLGRPPGQ